MKKMVDHNS